MSMFISFNGQQNAALRNHRALTSIITTSSDRTSPSICSGAHPLEMQRQLVGQIKKWHLKRLERVGNDYTTQLHYITESTYLCVLHHHSSFCDRKRHRYYDDTVTPSPGTWFMQLLFLSTVLRQILSLISGVTEHISDEYGRVQWWDQQHRWIVLLLILLL